mgnify:CR=1 FL=1
MNGKTYEDGLNDAASKLLEIAKIYVVEAEFFMSLRGKHNKATGRKYAKKAAEVASGARTVLRISPVVPARYCTTAQAANVLYERAFSLLLSMP